MILELDIGNTRCKWRLAEAPARAGACAVDELAATLGSLPERAAIARVRAGCVRGPQVMKGYWNKPEETAKVIMADGFLRTGDVAVVDEQGFARIVDRKKDMILVSGFNVYPNEIEDVVAMHPGVLEVGAVGVPDAGSGEAVKIVVVKSDPNLTEEALLAHCRKNLTGYKMPKIVEFRKELPKTNVGKILRRELR